MDSQSQTIQMLTIMENCKIVHIARPCVKEIRKVNVPEMRNKQNKTHALAMTNSHVRDDYCKMFTLALSVQISKLVAHR